MSQDSPQPPSGALPATAKQPSAVDPADREVIVYQHSNMFYWWPVWVFGFLFAAITYLGDTHMAIVPRGTHAVSGAQVSVPGKGDHVTRDVLVLDEKEKLLTYKNHADQDVVMQPTIFVSRHRSLGTMYLIVLLIVIFITNITLRGQWSLVLLVILSALSVIFWLAGFWEIIFERLGNMSIYINLGGYMMISLVVFLLWMVNYFVFDRQHYVIFAPGQVRLCMEIGSGEIIYDSFGMTIQKKRNDIYRHSILGFGSGDMVLRFPRVDHPIELHNILNINKVLKRVERMMEEKTMVAEAKSSDRADIAGGKPSSNT